MAVRDSINRVLKAMRLLYAGDDPVSGTNSIGVGARLTYEELYPLEDDGDLVYKAYLEENSDRQVTFTTDSNGEYNFSTHSGGDPLPAIPALKTLYQGTVNTAMGEFDYDTRVMKYLTPETEFTLIY